MRRSQLAMVRLDVFAARLPFGDAFGGGVAISRFMAASKPRPCVVTSFAFGINLFWHRLKIGASQNLFVLI